MAQARTVEAVERERERATVYVTWAICKIQQNIKNKRIEIKNIGGNTFVRDG